MSKKMDRRNFLKLAGTTAFAVSVTSVLGGCSEVPDAPRTLVTDTACTKFIR